MVLIKTKSSAVAAAQEALAKFSKVSAFTQQKNYKSVYSREKKLTSQI
jgi:hypothetical protein